MISRRQFVNRVALAAAAVPRLRLGSVGEQNCKPLPASIASLPSWKDKARPITNQERSTRLEKARRLMAINRLDAIMLTAGTSLTYFTGIRWWGGERLFAFLLPAKGAPFFVCPAFEEGRAREQIAHSPLADAEVRLWQEDESPYERVADGLKDRHIVTGTLGVEETVPFLFSNGVARAATHLRLASATPVTAGCRMIKTPHEIELMRLAAKVTLTAYDATYRALHDGTTQDDVSELIAAAHQKLGFTGSAD